MTNIFQSHYCCKIMKDIHTQQFTSMKHTSSFTGAIFVGPCSDRNLQCKSHHLPTSQAKVSRVCTRNPIESAFSYGVISCYIALNHIKSPPLNHVQQAIPPVHARVSDPRQFAILIHIWGFPRMEVHGGTQK